MTTTCRLLIIGVLVLAHGSSAAAQPADRLNLWLNQRLAALVESALPDIGDRATEAPSLAGASTTLVDHSTPPDLLSLALRVADAIRGSGDATGPTSVTLSAYALHTAFTHTDPLRPDVYARGTRWRQWAFTVGRDPGGDGALPAHLVGVKYLAVNRRDVGHSGTRSQLDALVKAGPAGAAGQAFANTISEIEDFMLERLEHQLPFTDREPPGSPERVVRFKTEFLAGDRFDETIAMLSPEALAEIDALIERRIRPAAELRRQVEATLERIRKAPQLAVAYQGRLRGDDGIDEHRWEAIFERGFMGSFGATLNASLDFVDRPAASDSQTARVAGEMQVILGDPPRNLDEGASLAEILARTRRPPVRLSVAGSGEWDSEIEDVYKVQTKLTIPVPGLRGAELPVSVTIASRTELIDETDVRGQVGFTIDFAKVVNALRP